ncbi:ferritin [Clostridium acetobutylicum]|uniref:Ferritin n=1 Tax=Clostridium acetobutylicum (strain ATCC 824 / DSM 792 / JCM 1419 / IAM 19013 / LMG 5710 / NBRC 13948 / NRRL B-527 / VKM B-1787 / 2291 / W) TaxID=272562 RepID=Q97KS2_CLOAB|nr:MULTISPECIES: ferritin [Clostridium]AAK78821.1 Ferritin-like protein Rsg [Clostridium acetobutylicum ATCC 824]ADZ19895.1 Ferritin-like protein Rsg [Clostridium acetobutylicum EA 2018]AEI33582.1 Ferritin-like protein Rsg [Clostridium acetobutylicum DSM 1731]AWV80539.1 ferritin [Clostridium acetobutylicum]KHD35863.1 ferritin [Clostridium acetobutylicum]
MLENNLLKLLNDQVTKEFYSAYFYLDIHNYFISKGLDGFGNWFYIQTQEEKDHAMLFLKYVEINSEDITLGNIPAPSLNFSDISTPLETTLKHERGITASINKIYEAAFSVKDFRTMQFLDWFVKEQGEEEKNTEDLVRKYELFGSDSKGLYLLDSELKTRVYTPATLVL